MRMELGCIKEESTSNVGSKIEIEIPCGPLVTSRRQRLESLTPLSSDCCIYRVSNNIRETNKAAFSPITVELSLLEFRGRRRSQRKRERESEIERERDFGTKFNSK